MTPAITLLTRHKISHEVIEFGHDPNATSYGLEAAEKLGVDPACVFKTLICTLSTGQHVVAVLPVSYQLSLKKLAQSAGAKKAAMAHLSQIPGITGYLPGGVSPLAQKKSLSTYVDTSITRFAHIYVSGGKRGLDIGLSPQVLISLTRARQAVLIDDAP
ncbi:Cys-tRNA(Pro) deacylase [Salinimonas lutimaris]|uniref:Cys-tRNA(Pro) deacylase n=1 Tax=Salinimonas lutimaris TaxID=914153 RepID=UPI0010C14760|nr:Cys-tRNA(Pro) deacylase [Salinimonas lutimaris]